jgi:DNA alkylation repair enzyme
MDITAASILDQLQALGSEGYRKILLRHGAALPCFGVKIADMKPIRKLVKKNYQLALDLYESGVYDARYLAGLIADDARMTREDLQRWVEQACRPLAGSTVPAVAAGSRYALESARAWIDAGNDLIPAAGWTTLSGYAALIQNPDPDPAEWGDLLDRVEKTIQHAPDATRYAMNGFVIAAGTYIASLTAIAETVAGRIGKVEVDPGETSCQVPDAVEYLRKMRDRGMIGKKRKTLKC